MSLFRYNGMWYRYRIRKFVYDKHADLYGSSSERASRLIKSSFSHRNCYLLIILSVALFFISAMYIDITRFNFLSLKIDNAKTIIDQRTSNIATIISISLVVIGFLINNLAIKSPTTYKLLFKKSFLYFTIYFILTTIGCCILISLFRDTLTEFVFTRFVIAASYLVIIVLVFIGILFRKILLFTNEKVIAGMMKDELLHESRLVLRKGLIKKYSAEHYPALFNGSAQKEFHSVSLDDLVGGKVQLASSFDPVEYELKDVNILMLKIYLTIKKRNTADLFYSSLALDEPIDAQKEIIWSNEKPNKSLAKWFLRKSLVIKKIVEPKEEDTYRKEFDQKIVQLAEESKYQNLSLYLDAILNIYELQMKNQ